MSLQNKHFKDFIFDQKIPILITIAFFLITSYVAIFHNNYWLVDHDGRITLQIGEEILAGDGKNIRLHNAPLGGPIIYAFLNSFFDDGFNLLKSIAVLSSSGAVFFSYFILKNIFNRKIALVGQLFFAFNPWLCFFAIQAENEMLPVFLISVSLYFITKKELKLRDMVVVGVVLGIASTIRFQALVVLITFIIFIFLRDRKVRKNFFFAITILLVFLIPLIPLIFYNYTTNETILGTGGAFFMTYNYQYQYPEWTEQVLQIHMDGGSTFDAIFVDLDLFLKNYFHNLFYNMPNRLFNFGYDNINSSLMNSVPFFGLIPAISVLIYKFKIKINKNNLIIVLSSAIVSTFLILLIGDIHSHFFAIVGIPLFLLALFNIKNIQKNALPLWILPVTFILIMSMAYIRQGEHFFIIWFSWAMLGGIFFADILPQLFKKIQPGKIKSDSPKITFLIIIIITLILLSNFGYGYILYKTTHTNVPFVSIENEFTKLFQEDIVWEQPGIEVKKIGDLLNKQPNIENSYVMVPHLDYHYYINANIVLGGFGEGTPNDTIENYVTRKNWTDFEIFNSNIHSRPMDVQNNNNPKPDYLVYKLNETNDSPWQHEYLRELINPESSLIPENFEVIHFSNEANMVHVVYKINHENDK